MSAKPVIGSWAVASHYFSCWSYTKDSQGKALKMAGKWLPLGSRGAGLHAPLGSRGLILCVQAVLTQAHHPCHESHARVLG